MAGYARQIGREKKFRERATSKRGKKFQRHRIRNLAKMPPLIREWAVSTLGEFEAMGISVGFAIPRPPTRTGELWRVVFALPYGLQCAECGGESPDCAARYIHIKRGDTEWLSASCDDCIKSRERSVPT